MGWDYNKLKYETKYFGYGYNDLKNRTESIGGNVTMMERWVTYSRKKRLGELLVDAGAITQEQLEDALAEQKKKTGQKLGAVLIDMGAITEDQMLDALQSQLGYPRVNLREFQIEDQIIAMTDEAFLRKNNIMPFGFSSNNPNLLKLAMCDPLDLRALDDFFLVSGHQAEIYIATAADISNAIGRYYGSAEAKRMAEQFSKERAESGRAQAAAEEENEALQQAPIVKLVTQIIEQAVRKRTSDIHIEPFEDVLRIRYRVDGVLQQEMEHKMDIHSAMIARIKIISGMDIAEKRKPQDGRATAIVDRNEYDIRVSMLPTVYGEKVVMRLTQKKALSRDKKDLGFPPEELTKFEKIISRPNGIMLVTGPTGSGKSTTLYTALSELNTIGVNIITVEDPVEANIFGINQVQTNEKAGLTFASALRSILRQDPDIIMIGEIRDQETAGIAVKAAITGHLVVSTLHTNSAASTITRLADMGVEDYLIADSVIGVIAQRLVRRICKSCCVDVEADQYERQMLQIPETQGPVMIKHPGKNHNCLECGGSGYHGRIGIYEIMPLSAKLKSVISRGGLPEEIEKTALEEGMKTLRMQAVSYALQGITSVEEVKRVTFEE